MSDHDIQRIVTAQRDIQEQHAKLERDVRRGHRITMVYTTLLLVCLLMLAVSIVLNAIALLRYIHIPKP